MLDKLKDSNINYPLLLIFFFPSLLLFFAFLNYYAGYLSNVEGYLDRDGHTFGRDFAAYWTAAQFAIEGNLQDLYDYEIFANTIESRFGVTGLFWHYPPFYLMFITPLGALDYMTAYCVWTGITLILYLLSASLLAREHGRFWLVVLVLAPATLLNFFIGQNGFLTAALLFAGFYLLDKQPRLAGIMFGLLTFKPHLGLFIPLILILTKRWHTFISATLTMCALIIISLLLFGITPWLLMIDNLSALRTTMLEQGEGTFQRIMPTIFMSLRTAGVEISIAHMIQLTSSISILGLTAWLSYHFKPEPLLLFAWVAVASFLALPYAYVYDMTSFSLLVMVLSVLAIKHRPRNGEVIVLFVAWWIPFFAIFFNRKDIFIAPIILAIIAGFIYVKIWKIAREA
jgi:hypothetical protein